MSVELVPLGRRQPLEVALDGACLVGVVHVAEDEVLAERHRQTEAVVVGGDRSRRRDEPDHPIDALAAVELDERIQHLVHARLRASSDPKLISSTTIAARRPTPVAKPRLVCSAMVCRRARLATASSTKNRTSR